MMAYLSFLRLVNLNEENKFLMNITEQDMEEFVNHTYMEINPARLLCANLSDGGTPSSGTRWCSVFHCRARGASRAIRW